MEVSFTTVNKLYRVRAMITSWFPIKIIMTRREKTFVIIAILKYYHTITYQIGDQLKEEVIPGLSVQTLCSIGPRDRGAYVHPGIPEVELLKSGMKR